MARALEESLLDVGVKHVNFFEGRILSGRDLREQQDAERAQRKQLGEAIGDGVVEGFRITVASAGSEAISPILRIEKGLAINRAGQTLLLPQSEDIQLVRSADAAAPDSDLFRNCAAQPAGTELPNGSGFYILTVGPASGFQGQAPKSGLDDSGKGVGCGSRYATLGLRFRLLRFDPSTLTGVSSALRAQIVNTLIPATAGIASLTAPIPRARNLALLRNIVANILLGRGPLATLALNPAGFGAPGSLAPVDPLDDLRGNTEQNLTDCEVPLTLLYWTVNGVEFLDTWSVRRVVRQAWDPASLSMPLGYGLERLLQFQEQIAPLNAAALLPSAMRIEQFFRFLPPAGFYPAIGPGSPLGMSSSGFFAAYTAGEPDDASVGMAAAILERSFLFPSVDLQQSPFLQQYVITENEAAASSGSISQLHILFVDRALNGPSGQDGVWETFSDAWDAYRGLILRRVFLPVGSTPDEAAARISIVEAVRDVMDTSTHLASRAGAWSLDRQRAFDAYARFHGIQRDLAQLLATGLSSVPDTQNRILFAQGLLQRLDTSLPGSGLALSTAVQAGNLIAAVAAQNEINRYVGQWSGEGVAIGPFVVDFVSSPDGATLVPGRSTPFRHRFRLRNGTDRRLVFGLTAATAAPTGTWEGSTSIHSMAGAAPSVAINSLTLDSGGSGNFEVRILAPQNAQVGETATLTVTASAPPPTSRSENRTLTLAIDTASSDPVTSAVAISPSFAGPNPSSGPPNRFVSYVFSFVYTTTTGPSTTAFDFFVDLRTAAGGAPPPGWNIGIDGPGNDGQTGGVFRRRINNVVAGAVRQVPVLVLTGPSNSSVEMRVLARSVSLTPAIENTAPFVINIASV